MLFSCLVSLGPCFFEGVATVKSHLQMLQEYVIPGLQLRACNFEDTCFMPYGAPAHFVNDLHSFLIETFPCL